MKNNFTYLLRVRFAECDPQKVVFSGKYAEFVALAVTEFQRAIWGDYNSILDAGIDNQTVNLNISWKSPAHFDDVLAISVQTIRIGNTSYTLQLDFINYASGVEIASAEIVLVMVSANEHKKMQIPEKLRLSLETGAPEIVSNHAGI